jgi:hypothetical protein
MFFTIILKSQKGTRDRGNCAKTVEAGLQKLPGTTEINLVFATESFGRN